MPHRGFFDPETLRSWVKNNAQAGFQKKLNEIETPTHKLVVDNVSFKDREFTPNDQKKALMEHRDIAVPLYGDFSLIDKRSNKVVDSKKHQLIAQVPHITDRNTAILGGSEYMPINQSRLKPGAYSRIRESGEVETHFNPVGGRMAKLVLHPDTGVFMYEVGTVRIGLYGILIGLGVSEGEIVRAWGRDIVNKNKTAYRGNEIDKLYDTISR